MQKLQKAIYWAVIASETSHVFCCVLPTLFSVLSLMAGLGLVGAIPAGIVSFHEIMHDWEIPLIALSGVVVLVGWGLYVYSRKIDCHDTGCEHGSCEPRKKTANTILKIATILFFVNVTIYTVFHRGMEANFSASEVHEGHDHGHDHAHDH